MKDTSAHWPSVFVLLVQKLKLQVFRLTFGRSFGKTRYNYIRFLKKSINFWKNDQIATKTPRHEVLTTKKTRRSRKGFKRYLLPQYDVIHLWSPDSGIYASLRQVEAQRKSKVER